MGMQINLLFLLVSLSLSPQLAVSSSSEYFLRRATLCSVILVKGPAGVFNVRTSTYGEVGEL